MRTATRSRRASGRWISTRSARAPSPPAQAVLQLAAPPLPRHPLSPLRLPSDAADPRSRAQVYKRAKGNLSKPARLAFRELDNMVGIATSVKDLRSEDP